MSRELGSAILYRLPFAKAVPNLPLSVMPRRHRCPLRSRHTGTTPGELEEEILGMDQQGRASSIGLSFPYLP